MALPRFLRLVAILAVLPPLLLKAALGIDKTSTPLLGTAVLLLVSGLYVTFWLVGGSGWLAVGLSAAAGGLSLTAALIPSSPVYMTFLWVYVAVMVGFVLDSRKAVVAEFVVVGVALLVIFITTGQNTEPWQSQATRVGQVGIVVPVAGLAAISVAQLLRSRATVAAARESLARLAVQEERARFSRDLHDVLGHTLSLAAIKLQLARKLERAHTVEAEQELRDVESLVRHALDSVRAVAAGYRQPTLASELVGAQVALQAAGIQFSVEGERQLLPAIIEGAIAWVVREGVTNVIRHSNAKKCQIKIQREQEIIRVEVADDGRGPTDSEATGLGLVGLAERLRPLGGRVHWACPPERGFRLLAEVPSQVGRDAS
jgi:two-component system, NarL family, sensor histidine kinase DesK